MADERDTRREAFEAGRGMFNVPTSEADTNVPRVPVVGPETGERTGSQNEPDARVGKLFPHIADVLRRLADEAGYDVYVSTNTRSVTLTKRGGKPRGEYDVCVKVRGNGV